MKMASLANAVAVIICRRLGPRLQGRVMGVFSADDVVQKYGKTAFSLKSLREERKRNEEKFGKSRYYVIRARLLHSNKDEERENPYS